MERGRNNRLDDRDCSDLCPAEAAPPVGFSRDGEQYQDGLIASATLFTTFSHRFSLNQQSAVRSFDDHSNHRTPSSISVAEFVIQKFIPDCVAGRRSSARSHFRTVLNHVLHPEFVSDALSTVRSATKKRLSTIPGWPYVDALQLREIDAGVIQHLAHAVLKRGYSTQMARQIRNMMSLIMSHAIRTGYYPGPNPAASVILPAMPQKETHSLNLAQLAGVLRAMVYPEKYIALFLVLAELRVTEICGLQWKYVNVSPSPRLVEGELIPPKTIAVRYQIYRGEFTKADGGRRRFVRISDLLFSVLRDLKSSPRLTGPENFVLASRNDTPVHPENIAARRLKSIGRSVEMPWLSWSAFVRTRNRLRSQSDRDLHEHLQRVLAASSQPHHVVHETR
jgi:integrase